MGNELIYIKKILFKIENDGKDSEYLKKARKENTLSF